MIASPALPKRVVIVGSDIDAWLSANTVLRALATHGVEVSVVETRSTLTPADVCEALPEFRKFMRLLNLPEAAVLQSGAGAFSLGQRFANFSGKGAFMNAYGPTGPASLSTNFVQHWVRARQMGLPAEYETFNLTAMAAQTGHVLMPARAVAGTMPSEYGYHLMAAGLASFLKAVAMRRGATVYAGEHFGLKWAQDGAISAVLASDGTVIEGDLFIDATGAQGRLIGALEAADTESWRDLYPCNRLLTAATGVFRPLPLYAQISASRHGWWGLYPQRSQTTLQMAFDSERLSDDEALEAARSLSGQALSGATVRDMAQGMRPQPWVKNCLAVGEAAARFDPLDAAPLQSLQIGLSHLVALYPVTADMAIERDIYNETVSDHYRRLRDYQLVRYRLNRRFDDPLWDRARVMTTPDALAYKLKVFEARGLMVRYDHESFNEDSWQMLAIGHGLIPKSYDPQIDHADDAATIRTFQNHLASIKQQIGIMTPHEEALMAVVQATAPA
jgi:tryptophan halogenase